MEELSKEELFYLIMMTESRIRENIEQNKIYNECDIDITRIININNMEIEKCQSILVKLNQKFDSMF